jgi:hypothetical protein
MRRRAEHKDHVWSYAFVVDLSEDGRRLKMMPVVDEYSRECLSIDVERSITAEDVVGTLVSLFGLDRGRWTHRSFGCYSRRRESQKCREQHRAIHQSSEQRPFASSVPLQTNPSPR